MVNITKRDEAAEKAAALSKAEKAPNAEPHVRARARILLSRLTERIEHWRKLVSDREAAARQVRTSIWAEAPASIADLVAYAKSAVWAGNDAPVLTALGRLYAYVVAIPSSLTLYAVAWLMQRPIRLAFAIFVVGLVWLTL
jgi:hypothetical protein